MDTVRDAAREIAQRTDCRVLLRRLVPTWAPVEKREETRTLHGPCPKCGGRNRFYVLATGAACNQCHKQRMDAAGLVAWLHGVKMTEAVRELDAGALREVAHTHAPVVTRACVQSEEWQHKAQTYISRVAARLHTPSGAAGRTYLLSRGLQPATWEAFSLGYEPARRITTDRTQTAPAIVWPVRHESTGVVTAVRFRYVGATATGDRYDSWYDSQTVDRLFGAGLLPGYALDVSCRAPVLATCALVVTEGEFNAAACWQAAHATGVDVLSFGSESQRRLPEWAVSVARRYGCVIVWVDSPNKAADVAAQLPGCVALRSPVDAAGVKWDANARLVAGTLGGLLLTARLSVARGSLREAILWQCWDVRHELDAGTLQVAQRLAKELGKTGEKWETPAGWKKNGRRLGQR